MTDSEITQMMQGIFDGLGEVTITEEFIALRDEKMTQLRQGSRSDYQFMMNVDCLMLEEWLIELEIVDAPLLEHHTKGGACVYDARVNLLDDTAFVDFKCIDKNMNYNVSEQKLETHPWVQDGVDRGLLTHYCFYQMHRPANRPLVVGDVVKFKLINVLNSQHVLDSLQPSRFGGKFYKVPKYV
jgi:hypothetical protein